MTQIELPVQQPGAPGGNGSQSPGSTMRVALLGNPNAGKTSLFNSLTGLRAKTANIPGTTVEHRIGRLRLSDDREAQLIDLPGLYSLDAATYDERVARDVVMGEQPGAQMPDLIVVVIDATNLERNLFLAGQVIELGRPTVVALNMYDLAQRQGVDIDLDKLQSQLGCPVVPVSARTGFGLAKLQQRIAQAADQLQPPTVHDTLQPCASCRGCHYAARYNWAERVVDQVSRGPAQSHGQMTEAIDRILTHRVVGVAVFAGVMLCTFMMIFWLAQYPMGMIESMFAFAQQTVGAWLPPGDVRSFIVDGVIAGVGGMLVFLPQICILFFLLALLEDTGYMARAAFVMDKLMYKVGLPGKAFVPMLSAHACAIPAIMSTRVIEDRRDRLATILVIPLMTCSARLPVYVMVAALLFQGAAIKGGILFTGAYALGIIAALAMAFVFKKTILPGQTRPLVMEMPSYRMPSLRNALLLTFDRAWVFVKNAGTIILLISLVLWALSTYPKLDESEWSAQLSAEVAQLEAAGEADAAANAIAQAELRHSLTGRIGQVIEPVFRPLGLDWKIGVGVVSSFAAREVIVSTLAVIYGMGEEGAEDGSIYGPLRASTWEDGSPVFTTAACLSLLVFYVLAMQCLPTQAVTKRETKTWKWPLFQLGYMTVLAYTAALITYQTAAALGYA